MNDSPISKKCAACGLEKPLTAFLILKEQGGAEYGNICADCRQAKAREKPKPDIEERSAPYIKLKIDNKTKVAIEKDKKEKIKEAEETETKHKEEIQKEENLEVEKITLKRTEEKRHREDFLDTLLIKKPISQQKEKELAERRKAQQKQQFEEFVSQKQINEVSLNTPLIEQTNTLKYQSHVFKQFLAWVGEGSSISKNMNKLHSNTNKSVNKEQEPRPEDLAKHISGPSKKK